jgi:NitT/TauT family transport system substrate-binding protein
LQNGQIDAAALWDPLPTIQEQKGTVDIIFDLGKNPKFAKRFCCFLYGSNKVIADNPQKMSAILRALNNARDFIAQHPQEAAKIITEKKYSTITDQKLAVQLFKDYDYAVQPNEDQRIQSDVSYFSEGLKKIGFLKTNDPAAFSTKIYKHIDQ